MSDPSGVAQPEAPRLLAACWTSAGDIGPGIGDERSPIPLRERIEAVGRTGWGGFGLFHVDLEDALRTMPIEDLGRIFADNGIETVEMEFLSDWWLPEGPARGRSDDVRRLLLEAAPALGVKTIKVGGDLSSAPLPFDAYVEAFGELAEEAGRAGTRVALEPMPMANIATAADGMRLVRGAASPYGGLCIDVWHVYRAGTPFADLPSILEPSAVFVVELDDASREVSGSLWTDTVDHRRYPGEGDIDLTAFVRAIRDLDFAGPWGVEILSREHRATELEEALTRAHDTALAVLGSAS